MRYMVLCMFVALIWAIGCVPNSPQMVGGGVETGNSQAVGRVIAQGKPIDSIQVRLVTDRWASDPNTLLSVTALTNDSGFYAFDSLPQGNFRITGCDQMGDSAFTRTIVIVNKKDSLYIGVDTLKPTSTVTGTVVRYDGSNPAGIKVSLRGTDRHMVIGTAGRFRFEKVAAGRQILVAQAEFLNNGIPQFLTINVPADTSVDYRFLIPLPTAKTIAILPGQVWAYQQKVWQNGILQDLASFFMNFAYVKDTTIDGHLFHQISERSMAACDIDNCLNVNMGSEYAYIGVYNDSVVVLRSKDNPYLTFTLFKKAGGLDTPPLSRQVISRVNFDTTRFSDILVPVIFTKQPNETWHSRDHSVTNNIPLLRKYTGNEIVTVPGGTFNCMRFEWQWDMASQDTSEEIPLTELSLARGVDYTTEAGCIKTECRFATFGEFGMRDSLYIEFTFLGPDTSGYRQQYPQMPTTVADSLDAVIDAHWSMDRFRTWMQALDSSGAIETITGPGYIDDDTSVYYRALYRLCRSYENMFFYDSISDWWNIPSLPDLIDSIANLTKITSVNDFANAPDYFRMMLLGDEYRAVFAQGWDDCDWDWRTHGVIDAANLSAPFGRSSTANTLAVRMRGVYRYISKVPYE